MTEPDVIVWMANAVIKGIPRDDLLHSLKHRREALERSLEQDLEKLLCACVAQTGQTAFLNDLSGAPRAILNYLCEDKFKEELAQVPA